MDFEVDEELRNFDWIVYVNRNFLSLLGILKGGVFYYEGFFDLESENFVF